jgi:hypothetical protein
VTDREVEYRLISAMLSLLSVDSAFAGSMDDLTDQCADRVWSAVLLDLDDIELEALSSSAANHDGLKRQSFIGMTDDPDRYRESVELNGRMLHVLLRPFELKTLLRVLILHDVPAGSRFGAPSH